MLYYKVIQEVQNLRDDSQTGISLARITMPEFSSVQLINL